MGCGELGGRRPALAIRRWLVWLDHDAAVSRHPGPRRGGFFGTPYLFGVELRSREALQTYYRPNGDFPIAGLDEAVKAAGRLAASSQDAVENVLSTTYGDDTCFLALSLLYDDRNWGTMPHSIDHLFAQDEFKKRTIPDHIKELRDDFGNLALVIGEENSGKKSRPLDEWLGSRSPEYLKRHLIPTDESLWDMEKYENFLIERRKLLRARIQQVFSVGGEIEARPRAAALS